MDPDPLVKATRQPETFKWPQEILLQLREYQLRDSRTERERQRRWNDSTGWRYTTNICKRHWNLRADRSESCLIWTQSRCFPKIIYLNTIYVFLFLLYVTCGKQQLPRHSLETVILWTDKLLKQYFGRTFYFLKQDHLQGEASPSLCEPAQKILYAFSTEADYWNVSGKWRKLLILLSQ